MKNFNDLRQNNNLFVMAGCIGLFTPKLDLLTIDKDCCSSSSSSSSSIHDAVTNSQGNSHEKDTSREEQILNKWLKT